MLHYILLKTNSRLGRKKFPFSRQRELTRKRLISLLVCGAETALLTQNRKNSRFHGNNQETHSGPPSPPWPRLCYECAQGTRHSEEATRCSRAITACFLMFRSKTGRSSNGRAAPGWRSGSSPISNSSRSAAAL